MIDVYKIGVAISMTNGISQVLTVIQKDVMGLKHAVDLTEKSFGRMHYAVLGMGMAMGGGAVLGVMGKLIEHGSAFVTQQNRMQQAGMTTAEVAKATATAWKMAHDTMNTGATEALTLVQDLRNTLGGMGEATMVAPVMAQVNAVIANITGKPAGTAGRDLAKYLEQSGALTDPTTGKMSTARLQQQAHMSEAIIAAMPNVGPDKLLAFQQMARVSGMMLSDEGRIDIVPLINASKNASSVGTALSSASQQLLGGVQLTKNSVNHLHDIGMLNMKDVKEGSGGKLQLGEGALVNTEGFRANIADWVWHTLMPHLAAHGRTTVQQQLAWVQSSGLRATVQGAISELIRNETPFEKDITNIHKAEKVDQYKLLQDSPKAITDDFEQAWGSLLTALGTPMVMVAYHSLAHITAAMKDLTAWAVAHPEAVKDIETAVVILAGGVAGGGILMVLGAALSALSVVLLPFAVGAVAFVALDWLTGGHGLKALGDSIAYLYDKAKAVEDWIIKAPTGPGTVDAMNKSIAAGSAAADKAQAANLTAGQKRLNYYKSLHINENPTDDDPGGATIKKESFVPPSGGGGKVQVHTVLYLGKQVLLNAVTDHLADKVSRNPSTTTQFDPRVTPLFPSNVGPI